MLFEPVAPDVVDLLDAQRYAAVLRVDLQHLGGNVFALLEHLVRILDAARPAYVSDVHQTVKAILDLHERAELRDVPHLPGHHRAHRILLGDQQPGICLGLLDSQRNTPVARLDVQHHHVHFFANFDDLRGVLDFLVPAHFGDVHQAFDPLFQLDEHAIVHDPDDLALHLSARRIFLRGAHPGIGRQLLQPERYALLFLVKLQDDDVEFLLWLHQVRRVLHAAPAQIRQVQQPIDSAEIHERAVFGHVLHVAMYDLAFAQGFHQFGALGMQFFLQQRAAAHHHVAAAAVQLRDAHLHLRAGQVIQVLRRSQVVLRARQERAHADIHHQPALDAIHNFAGERFLGLERCFNLLPGAAAQHF